MFSRRIINSSILANIATDPEANEKGYMSFEEGYYNFLF